MKKGWKIALISLGSLLGLVVVVVAVAMYLVFTPSRLTKIVNRLASDYIACETHFDRVDLTLLSTFPDAGLKVENVYLVNPTPGAPSDTLARIASLTVGLDVKAFLSERRIKVQVAPTSTSFPPPTPPLPTPPPRSPNTSTSRRSRSAPSMPATSTSAVASTPPSKTSASPSKARFATTTSTPISPSAASI